MSAIDVLICTFERPDHVMNAVRDVLHQLGERDALWVVDQSERVQPTGDAIEDLADARVRHVAAPARGLPAARNLALSLSDRPLVVFFDDDVRLSSGCLQAHRHALELEGVGATVGATTEPTQRWNAARTMNRVGADGRVRTCLEGEVAIDVQSVKGCNMGFRRSLVEAAGGFDEGLGGTALLEETDLSERLVRAGWRIRFVPDAHLVHLAAPAGGVRVGDARRTAWWRFHNTGRFIARHRPASLPRVATTFAAIATRRAAEWGDPRAAVVLMGALFQGWRSAFRG